MTEPSTLAIDPYLKPWVNVWQKCLEQVITQAAGHSSVFTASNETIPAADSDLCFTVVSSGAARGEMTLRLSSACAVLLAQGIKGEAGAAADLTPERKEAVEQLLRRVAGQAATSMAHPGGEVQFQLSACALPSWSAAAAITLQTIESGSPISFELKISAALAAALRPVAGDTDAVPATHPAYDRFLDVPLEVKIRFGSRRMILRDVLALSTGAVLELDRNLQSPVDLLLDGRVIAQGEVVVVDGKYGLRVTDVFNAASLS